MFPLLTQLLAEMAAPSPQLRAQRLYHGTGTLAAAEAIARDGLDPAATEVKYGARKPTARPVAGRVYLTPELKYAGIYALGGDMWGSTYDMSEGGREPRGYIFEFDGADLLDVHPDEDSVGEFLYRWVQTGSSREFYDKHYPGWYERAKDVMPSVFRTADRVLTDGQWRKLRSGEMIGQIAAGKKILSHLTDEQKTGLIELGAHVAHEGAIRPVRAWSFAKADSGKVARDGSNLRDILEPFPLP